MKASQEEYQQKLDQLENKIFELRKELSEESEEIPEDTAYPWNEHIEKFIDPEIMPEAISFEELENLEKFAKKETLSKNQLKQLQSLHGDLDAAKGRLEAYFKKPPITRSEIDEEIKAIQDAMAELLRSAKVKRIIVDPFVYSLRKIRTHFKTISESKAIESLKKKKLGKFIKKVEVIDMGNLREYLLKSKVNIPGLRKIEDDVSIYIYEKHGEEYGEDHEGNYELVNIIEPDGTVKFGEVGEDGIIFEELPKSKMQFAVQRVKEFLQKNSVVYTMRSHNLPDKLINAEGTGRALRQNLGKITPELMEKYVKQSGFDTVEEWNKAATKYGKPEKMYLYKVVSKPSVVEIGRKVVRGVGREGQAVGEKKVALVGAPERLKKELVEIPEKLKTLPEYAKKNMAIVGSVQTTNDMIEVAKIKTREALKAGWGITTGGAKGIDAAVIEEVLKNKAASRLTVYLPKAISDQPSAVRDLLKKAADEGAKIVENEGFTRAARETGKKASQISFPQALVTRNKSIVEDAKAMVAVQFDPKTSKGTRHSINFALKEGIPIKHFDKDMNESLLRRIKNQIKKIPIGKFKLIRRVLPGIAAILTAVDFARVWKKIENLEEKVKEGKANEEERETWKYLQEVKRGEMSEDWSYEEPDEDSEDSEGIENNENVGSTEPNHAGLYLTAPHSELIHTGTKTAIVKSKKFDKHINEPLYLISDDKCYGVIELDTPVEIDKKEFGERYSEHLVEDFERVEWWGEDSSLYLYDVKMIEKFKPVREVEVEKGVQVFILPENVKFK